MKYLSVRRLYAASVLSLLFSFCMVSPSTVHAAGTPVVSARFGSHTISDKLFTHQSAHRLFSSHTYTITLEKGEQYQLPKGSDDTSVLKYSSNKKSIATVNANGMITAHKPGQTAIFIHTRELSAVYQVQVRKSSLALRNPSYDLFHCRQVS